MINPCLFASARSLFSVLFVFFGVTLAQVYGQVTDTALVRLEVDSLLTLATNLWRLEKNEEALPLAQKAADISFQQWGGNNARYASSLHRLASIYTNLVELEKAEELYLKAIDLRLKVLGREHLDYASSLNNLANLYVSKGVFDKAELLFLESIEIRGIVLGENHPDYASSLNALGILYFDKADYTKAERLYLAAKEIRVKVLGEEHPDYAQSLSNLGILYSSMGDYTRAELLYLESMEVYAKKTGKEHFYYGCVLENIGNLYSDKCDYEKAEEFYLEAKDILAKTLGKEHLYYITCLSNLATLYSDKGDNAKAELHLLETIDIRGKSSGKTSMNYTSALNNLANFYANSGDYGKAEQLYLEAKETWLKNHDKYNPDYAKYLNNIALLYHKKGDFNKAELFFVEAIEINAQVLGKEHPEYANYLNNLADLYIDQSAYYKAEFMLLEAKDIVIKSLGREHLYYATSLMNLAKLNAENGVFFKAEPLYLEAEKVLKKVLGREHSRYAMVLFNLALLYRETDRFSTATDFFLELRSLILDLIEKSAAYSSESQMLAYLHTFDDDLAQFQSFSQTYPNPSLARASYNNALFYNGYLLENSRRLARSVVSADSLTRDTYERWQGCRRRLSNEYAKPIAERKYVAEVEAEAEGYEKTLTRNLAVFGETRKTPQWEAVRDHLHPGEAAVEFIHYRYYKPKATDSTMYAALVLLPGDTCPHLVPLCEQRSLDSLLHQKYQDKKYTRPANGTSLFSLLWQPIEPLLQGVKTVYYAPSGALHSLNLDAIALTPQSDSTLIDQYKLVRLGSTRQLVAPVTTSMVGNDALLFGGIRYESDSTAIQKENNRYGVAMRGSSENGLPELVDSLQTINALEPLPSTLAEVQFIRQRLQQRQFNAPLFTGFGASEEVFKHLADSISASGASARVLHLATHGYFFPDPKSDDRPSNSGLRDEPVFRISEHPFLRSGLILAGGNHAWQTGKPYKEGMEDGILTAYEISGMSLQNTELVVLSACETGLGDVTGNEGVYGLQRAFKIAGARYLIMSLWKVPDAATKDLMSAFYTNWLDEKMEIPAAFRAAQRAMKLKYGDAEMWAGFVLVE